jgi:Zn-dependent protease with chaperone function
VPDQSPTIVALEVGSAWVVILAVSLVTFLATILVRKMISRPGGFSSGLLLALPLLLPVIAAAVYRHAVLPEVAVLRPVGAALADKPKELLHLLLVPHGSRATFYVFSGEAGPWVFLVGAGVSSFMLIRRLAGSLVLHRLLRRCLPPGPDDPNIVAAVESLASAAGLKRTPELLLLPDGVSGAFATGFRRNRILISVDLVATLDQAELNAILGHEIAHLQARDVPVVFLAGLLRDVVAWNPIAHIAWRRLLLDRELEADRRAALMTGEPLFLASGLLKILRLMKGQRSFSQKAALAFLRPGARIKQRVTHLLALADGRVVAGPVGRNVYLMAALLVAVLGLQVGARIAADDSAYAIVLGEADSTSDKVWHPGAETKPLRQLYPRVEKGTVPRRLRPSKLDRLLRSTELRADLTLKQKDVGRYFKRIFNMAPLLGLPPASLQWDGRAGWGQATPLLQQTSFSVYRLDAD